MLAPVEPLRSDTCTHRYGSLRRNRSNHPKRKQLPEEVAEKRFPRLVMSICCDGLSWGSTGWQCTRHSASAAFSLVRRLGAPFRVFPPRSVVHYALHSSLCQICVSLFTDITGCFDCATTKLRTHTRAAAYDLADTREQSRRKANTRKGHHGGAHA